MQFHTRLYKINICLKFWNRKQFYKLDCRKFILQNVDMKRLEVFSLLEIQSF